MDTKNDFSKHLLFSRNEIQERVKAIATEITSDYKGKEPVLIGLLNGSIFFYADLAREIEIPLKMDFIRVASYGSKMESSGSIKMTKDVEMSLSGKQVIIVDDIMDTGNTLSYILNYIRSMNTESVRICALIDKNARRTSDIKIDYCGFRVQDGFLVGYGLDYNEKYRNLPDIYTLI